jgi:hypothetical protein
VRTLFCQNVCNLFRIQGLCINICLSFFKFLSPSRLLIYLYVQTIILQMRMVFVKCRAIICLSIFSGCLCLCQCLIVMTLFFKHILAGEPERKSQVEVFWVPTQCSVAVGCQRFGGLFCLHLLVCYVVWCCGRIPKFRRTLLPPSSPPWKPDISHQERKRILGRSKNRWEVNIKTDL